MTTNAPTSTRACALTTVPLRHPQGCCTYLVADPASREAMAIDVHLDLMHELAEHAREDDLALRWIVDTHTHADHPSGAAALARLTGAKRVAHAAGGHVGVDVHPADGETLPLGEHAVTVRHAPGHTPDHLVLLTDHELFSGDSLFIGGVARTDFLGGDAGTLFDSLHRIVDPLADEVVLYPGHDYEKRSRSTIGAERAQNPWLAMERSAFVENLIANPPARPANMDDLLRLNRTGVPIPRAISAAETAEHVARGGATTVIDVRTGAEYEAEHVPGSRLVPLDQLVRRLDEVRATPAPRLLLCRTGTRARTALETLAAQHVEGLTVVEGGIEAYAHAGGPLERGRSTISLERQVRIAAGALVLVGLALAWSIHPAFALLSAFVGAGLVFAGITDHCGMALALARAPWNRGGSAATTAAAAGGTCAAQAPGAAGACAAQAPVAPPAACAASAPPSGKD